MVCQSSQHLYLLSTDEVWVLTSLSPLFFSLFHFQFSFNYTIIFALSNLIYFCFVTRVVFLCVFFPKLNVMKRICIIMTWINYLLPTQTVSMISVSQLLWYTKEPVSLVRFKWILFLCRLSKSFHLLMCVIYLLSLSYKLIYAWY